MKVPLNYMSALAICRATDEQVKVEGPKDEATGKHRGIVKVLIGGSWESLIELDPVYDTEEYAVFALKKFVQRIRLTTPFEGQHWPKENGPIPFGWSVKAGPNGERILAGAGLKKQRGTNHTPPKKRR